MELTLNHGLFLYNIAPSPLLSTEESALPRASWLAVLNIKMSVNLSKNGPALTAAYKEVVDEKSDTNW